MDPVLIASRCYCSGGGDHQLAIDVMANATTVVPTANTTNFQTSWMKSMRDIKHPYQAFSELTAPAMGTTRPLRMCTR